MSSRKYLQHPLLVAGLVIGGLGASPAPAAADDAARSFIVAQGSGEVRVRPDSVHVDVGAEAQAATLDAARTQVSSAMARVLDALHALDLPSLTIETQQVRFNPVYGTARDGAPPAIVGFAASNHVLVTARNAPDAELAGRAARIVDAALNAGANSVGALDFFLADASDAEDAALTLAVQNAANDAQTIAKAAGVTIVGPVAIEEGSAARAPRALTMAMAPMASTPVEVGDISISSSVTAKYLFR